MKAGLYLAALAMLGRLPEALAVAQLLEGERKAHEHARALKRIEEEVKGARDAK